jgi:hypothetical protein
MKTKISLFLSLFLVSFLISCESLDPEQFKNDLTSIADDEIISLKSEDIGDEDARAPMFGDKSHGFGERMIGHRFNSDCATITESGDDYPKEIVIDYGDGCVGKKGEIISGKIIISISADMKEAGASMEMRYEEFYLGDKKIDQLKTKTNLGQNGDGNWVLESKEEITITYADGSSSSRNSVSTTEWISGYDTEQSEDDVFLRSGSGLVVTSEGDEFSREITEPLLFDRSCQYIKSGVIELNKAGTEIIIDFGDGECDEWATITKDGESTEVDLSKRGKGAPGFRGMGKGSGHVKGNGKGGK